MQRKLTRESLLKITPEEIEQLTKKELENIIPELALAAATSNNENLETVFSKHQQAQAALEKIKQQEQQQKEAELTHIDYSIFPLPDLIGLIALMEEEEKALNQTELPDSKRLQITRDILTACKKALGEKSPVQEEKQPNVQPLDVAQLKEMKKKMEESIGDKPLDVTTRNFFPALCATLEEITDRLEAEGAKRKAEYDQHDLELLKAILQSLALQSGEGESEEYIWTKQYLKNRVAAQHPAGQKGLPEKELTSEKTAITLAFEEGAFLLKKLVNYNERGQEVPTPEALARIEPLNRAFASAQSSGQIDPLFTTVKSLRRAALKHRESLAVSFLHKYTQLERDTPKYNTTANKINAQLDFIDTKIKEFDQSDTKNLELQKKAGEEVTQAFNTFEVTFKQLRQSVASLTLPDPSVSTSLPSNLNLQSKYETYDLDILEGIVASLENSSEYTEAKQCLDRRLAKKTSDIPNVEHPDEFVENIQYQFVLAHQEGVFLLEKLTDCDERGKPMPSETTKGKRKELNKAFNLATESFSKKHLEYAPLFSTIKNLRKLAQEECKAKTDSLLEKYKKVEKDIKKYETVAREINLKLNAIDNQRKQLDKCETITNWGLLAEARQTSYDLFNEFEIEFNKLKAVIQPQSKRVPLSMLFTAPPESQNTVTLRLPEVPVSRSTTPTQPMSHNKPG